MRFTELKKEGGWRQKSRWIEATTAMIAFLGPRRCRRLAAPICETPEKRARFEKTLVAIRDIIRDLEEISSKRIVDELAQVEDGPWVKWGKGRHKKPLTQNALARLLKPYKVFPVDVGPEHARRKGYMRAQFEHLFEAYLNPLPSVPDAQPRSRAEGDGGDNRAARSGCADGTHGSLEALRDCADDHRWGSGRGVPAGQ